MIQTIDTKHCYITFILRQNLQLNTNQLLVTLLSHVYQWCCNITSTVVPVLEITAPYRSVLECRIIWRLRACLHWHYNTSGHVKQACKKSTGGLADHPQTLYMITSLTVWNLDVSHSCCSARWFAKGLTNLLVSNVCYIVSWIRTDSKMHQNCTQLILMVRSYPKKKNNSNNNERKPVLTVIGIKKKILKKCASSYLPEPPLLTCSVISRLSGNWMNEFNFFLYPVFLYTKNNTDE